MPALTRPSPGLPPAAASRPCALVVEDDSQVREILSVVLEDDYDVICAAQPEAALATLLSGSRIDVILLDYFLAGGNGRGIAKHADQAGVPMVWMTASMNAIEMNGTHTILLKPFGVQAVLDALANAREGR